MDNTGEEYYVSPDTAIELAHNIRSARSWAHFAKSSAFIFAWLERLSSEWIAIDGNSLSNDDALGLGHCFRLGLALKSERYRVLDADLRSAEITTVQTGVPTGADIDSRRHHLTKTVIAAAKLIWPSANSIRILPPEGVYEASRSSEGELVWSWLVAGANREVVKGKLRERVPPKLNVAIRSASMKPIASTNATASIDEDSHTITGSLPERAVAAKVSHPEWSDQQVADAIGCRRETLFKPNMSLYKAAKKALASNRDKYRPM